MPEPIEGQYFNWLCAKVQRFEFPTYHDMLKKLFETEFVVLDPRDESRSDDGIELRWLFTISAKTDPDPAWERTGCSILEMIIALSERGWSLTDIPTQTWFWKIIENLGLEKYRRVGRGDILDIEDILYDLNWRQYEADGSGGMFPMQYFSGEDQRSVEIWYQLCQYIEEENLV